jgi:hypothetical protein
MSDDIQEPIVVETGSDMAYDPFDEVVEEGDFTDEVEVEASEESEESSEEISEEPKEEENESDESESGEEGEDGSEEEIEESESKEDKVEEGESKEEPSEDEQEPTVELSKQIEDGSLEVEIGEEKVALKELKNSYMGQKEIARRFTEYDIKSKQLEADTNEINGYVNEFASILKSGDAVGAMSYLGDFAGTPPYMIKEQLIAALRPEIVRREQMTATEIQNEYLSHQNKYLQESRESELKMREAEQANIELQNSITELRETNGIDEQTYNDAKATLEQTLGEGEELTPELVIETVNYGRMYEQAESVVKSSVEQLPNEQEVIEALVDVKERNPEYTDEDLQEILKIALDSTKKTSVEQKLAQKVEKKSKPVAKQTKQTNPAEDDGIDPELDDWL